ncbi:hypothetical protein V1525DRAFT_399506 [Lipomyces kononenkoae]|uniref:Uncharacterized protein n=1 Tax=Lipomyces kononenkoae TaxID=34357 RepID=A0ACC3T4Y5_LIPKO
MAKLVEHITTETVDSVKRRFLRQNRELARVNSSHSTRIGNLESKIASLLSENLELRQQIIAIEHSREKWITRTCSEVRMKIQRKVKEIDELLEAFEISAKDAIYVSPAGESDDMGRRDSLDNSIVGLPAASAIHISTRKKSSPKERVTSPPPVYLDDGNDEQVDIDLIRDNHPRSPQLKEAHRFMPEELSAEEIPESPSELAEEQWRLPNIVSGMETVRPRRRRRDSLHELDIVSMVKTQNANYKAKLSSQYSSGPGADAEKMSEAVGSGAVTEENSAIPIALADNLPPPSPPSPPPPPLLLLPEPAPVAIREVKKSETKTTATKRRASMTVTDNDPSSHTVEKSTKSMPSARLSSRRSSVHRQSLLETEITNGTRESSPPLATRRLSSRGTISSDTAADKAPRSAAPTDHSRVKLAEKDKNVVDSKDKKAAEKAANPERKALRPLNVNLEPDVAEVTVKMPIEEPIIDTEVKPAEADQAKSEPEHDRNVSTSPDGGRRASRQRKSVNYALPSLRVKMRREQEQFIDAVTVLDNSESTSETHQSSAVVQPHRDMDVKIKRESTEECTALDFSRIPEVGPSAGGLDGVKRKRWSSGTDDIKREPADERATVVSRPTKSNIVTKPRRPAATNNSPQRRITPGHDAAAEVHTIAARRDSGILTSTAANAARRPNRHVSASEHDQGKTAATVKRRLSMVA